MVAVHNIILAIGVTKAASLPKPEQRLITATDVFDVIAEQCHHVVVDQIPDNSMIKAWRKKYLEKTRQFKRFVETNKCAVFELDELSGEIGTSQRQNTPLLASSNSTTAFDQYHAAMGDDGELSLREIFHLSLNAIEELDDEKTRTIYNPIDVIDTAHGIDDIVSFKQKMNACDALFRTVINAHAAECNSRKSQMKRFTRMFLRANVKYAKYSRKYLF